MGINIVQQEEKTGISISSLVTDAPGVAWTSGNILIALVRGSVVSSITGGGATGGWTRIQSNSNINAFTSEIWYAYNDSGGSQAVTVNCAFTSALQVLIVELSGCVTSGDPSDGKTGAAGNNGTSINSGNVTPTAGTEVILFNCGRFQANTASTAGPSGWTDLLGGAPPTGTPASYKIISSASGGYNATYAIGYNRYAVSIVAIKAAPPAPAGNRTVIRGICRGIAR